MSKLLKFFEQYRKESYHVADQNTPRYEAGQTVIASDDVCCAENDWEDEKKEN